MIFGHPDLRAARLELQRDPFEQWAGIDGAHQADVEKELVACEAIDEDQGDMLIGAHIRWCLGEELVGEGNLLLIDSRTWERSELFGMPSAEAVGMMEGMASSKWADRSLRRMKITTSNGLHAGNGALI